MNKEKLMAYFQAQRQTIRELTEQINNQYYYQEEAVSRANKRAEACRRESEDRARQEESDKWYRESELRSATKDLERARSYGDEWGEARALRKIKSIY